jgi:chorismate synthase
MKLVIGYLRAINQYVSTEKGRHDLLDYIRAVVIIGAVMAMVRVLWDMLLMSGIYSFFTR